MSNGIAQNMIECWPTVAINAEMATHNPANFEEPEEPPGPYDTGADAGDLWFLPEADAG